MRTKIVGLWVLGWASLVVSGCGTVTTALREDAVTVQALKAKKTYCESVPRIYSGGGGGGGGWPTTCVYCMGRRIRERGSH